MSDFQFLVVPNLRPGFEVESGVGPQLRVLTNIYLEIVMELDIELQLLTFLSRSPDLVVELLARLQLLVVPDLALEVVTELETGLPLLNVLGRSLDFVVELSADLLEDLDIEVPSAELPLPYRRPGSRLAPRPNVH